MRFSVWPSPVRPWDEVLELSRYAEDTGWDGVYFADHFMSPVCAYAAVRSR